MLSRLLTLMRNSVAAPGQQVFPDGIQMDDSAANVEIFEKETLYTVGHYFNSLS